MFIIYDLIFLAVALIYLPVYLFRRKFYRGFLLRLGLLPKNLGLDRPIWLHAVSVGEAMAAKRLLEQLRVAYSDKRFIISTVTSTGNKIAVSISKESDFVTYLPLDLNFIVKSVIGRLNPQIFILTETEFWPNLINCLHKKRIPIVVVSGRISDRSFCGYRSIKFLIKSILNKINLFCVQTERDAERLISLGVFKEKIRVTGNMKFDTTDYTDKRHSDHTDKYRASLGLSQKEKLWVAGSTHPGEEKIILTTYRKLLDEFFDLRLLIAPRHPERTREVEKIVVKHGFSPTKISYLDQQTNKPTNQQTVFILDTVGELVSFYAIADIVFVGGSLVKKGGHNILEPAALGKPVIFGPYMFNFRDIADLFLNNKAAILVHNQEELKTNIEYLLNNPAKISQLGQRAKELIRQNQGATQKNIELIRGLISECINDLPIC